MERLGVRRIEVGRRGMAGAASDGGFARFYSRELEEGKGMDGSGSFQGLREEKSGARTARFARCLMRGGARRRPDDGMGIGRAQCRTGEEQYMFE